MRSSALLVAVTVVGLGCGANPVGRVSVDAGSSSPVDAGQPGARKSATRSALVIAGEAISMERGCSTCHSSVNGLLAGSNLGVRNRTVYAPNITPDLETGIGTWSDADIIQAIRFGVDDEGKTLCSEMPRAPNLSDDDAVKLVAFMRSVEPVLNETTTSVCTPAPADVALHGQLVAKTAGCTGCHRANLAGSDSALPGTQSFAPNLTPDVETGLGGWTKEQLIAAVKTGIDDEGAVLCSTMPRYSMLSDEELNALATYLKQVPAVVHQTHETECGAPRVDAGVAPVEDAGISQPHDAGHAIDAGVAVPFDAGTAAVDAGTAHCATSTVVISQVYGGGGNTGAPFNSDFVELHNRSAQVVSIGGWSIQYASSAGTSWTVATIPAGRTLQPGAFVAFSFATGTTGMAVPQAVSISGTNLSGSAGKVALSSTATALSGACPSSANLVDFVGYGAANCSEGSMPTATLSNATAAVRRSANGLDACADSDVNSSDFAATAPVVHSAPVVCSCP